MTDATNLIRIVQETQPTEIYNLAAQSHVRCRSRRRNTPPMPTPSARLRLLEAIRILKLEKRVRFYQASTSELYGKAQRDAAEGNHAVLSAQSLCGGEALRLLDHGELPRGLRHARLERHPVQPRGPDPRRDLRHAQDHARGRRHRMRPAGQALHRQSRRQARLGPCASDYVEGMWRIVQQPKPDDYVLATGEAHSVREFVEKAFACVGRSDRLAGRGRDEEGIDKKSGSGAGAGRSALFPADRSGPSARRPDQGAHQARLDSTRSPSTSWCAKWSRPISPPPARTTRAAPGLNKD